MVHGEAVVLKEEEKVGVWRRANVVGSTYRRQFYYKRDRVGAGSTTFIGSGMDVHEIGGGKRYG
jgi:hypothetical protein